jgi:phosphoribosylformylglycinamidine synthase
MGGSHYHLVEELKGGWVPAVDFALAARIFHALHEAIRSDLLRAVHDCSEGGVAVALAEMAFAGEVGADVTGIDFTTLPEHVALFAESATRFVLEVPPNLVADVQECFEGLPLREIGKTVKEPRLRIAGKASDWIVWAKLADLKEAWQKPLRW